MKALEISLVLTSNESEAYEYENDGDRIYRTAVRNLFETEKDPIEVQKWREFYHDMEKCFDACSDLAGSVERAAVKNS